MFPATSHGQVTAIKLSDTLEWQAWRQAILSLTIIHSCTVLTTYSHTHTHTLTLTHTLIHIHTYIDTLTYHTHKHLHTYMQTLTHSHVYTHTHTHTHTHTNTQIDTHESARTIKEYGMVIHFCTFVVLFQRFLKII